MTHRAIVIASLLLGTACAHAAPPDHAAAAGLPTPVAPDPSIVSINLTADSSLDDALDALDLAGKTLKDFSADLKLNVIDSVKNDKTRSGRIWYQKKTGDDARLRTAFDKVQIGDVTRDDKADYLLDDGWLTEINYRAKKVIKHQVLQPDQKMNPLKLGEGPFPLPIGQDKVTVKKEFEAKKIAAGKDDPAGTIHIQLAPKPDTQLARKYSTIDLFVDLKSQFPTHIEAVDANGSTQTTADLSNLKLNPHLGNDVFVQPAIREFEEVREPLVVTKPVPIEEK